MSGESNDRRMESDFVRSGEALGFGQEEVEELLNDKPAALKAAARLENLADNSQGTLAAELRKKAAWLRELAKQEGK
jgi:hypothetical protein